MCVHAAIPSADDIKEEMPEIIINDPSQPEIFHTNAFTRPLVPILTNIDMQLNYGYWGIIPPYVKDVDTFKASTYNARNDKIYETKTYKNLIGKQMCLMFVNGFYEYHTGDKKFKTPYFIHMPEKRVFTFGCIYGIWQDNFTISIITTAANTRMSEIHNTKERMPLIIQPEDRLDWLNASEPEEINSLMQPLKDGILQDYTISKNLTARGYNTNTEEIQQFVPYGENGALF